MMATTTARPEAMARNCRRPGSGTWIPSRVVKTLGGLPLTPSARRRLTVSHTAATAKAIVKRIDCERMTVRNTCGYPTSPNHSQSV